MIFLVFWNRRTVENSATSRSIGNHNTFLKLQLSHSFTKRCISHKPTLEVLHALMTLIITVNILLSTLKQIEILAISRFKMIWRKRLRLCEASLGLIKRQGSILILVRFKQVSLRVWMDVHLGLSGRSNVNRRKSFSYSDYLWKFDVLTVWERSSTVYQQNKIKPQSFWDVFLETIPRKRTSVIPRNVH